MSSTSAPLIPFDEIRSWLFEQALPFWAAHGVDHEHGGFHEELGRDGAPAACAYRRTRVTCRQTYVFSHAALLGWREGEKLAAHGCAFLEGQAYLGAEGGWARRLSREGEVIDPAPDLYDLAFVMFAFAWRFRASGDEGALRGLHEVHAFVQRRMRLNEGFAHILPMKGPRLQNPHMHLLEASLAAYEATSQAAFLDLAKELVVLFRRRLFDGAVLREYFTDDWRPHAGDEGRIVEPGHMFEWAWILFHYGAMTGEPADAEARVLIDFAETHGVNDAGHVVNSCYNDGLVRDAASRLWTNTERMKAHLALFEAAGVDTRATLAATTRILLDRYFLATPRGGWADICDAGGAPTSGPITASIFYHVFLAFAELLRLEPRLHALG